MKTLLRVLVVLAAVSLLTAAGIVIFDFFQVKEKFPRHTFIGSVDVSGLDRSKAAEKISQINLADIYSPVITFEVEKLVFAFSPEAIGIKIDKDKSIENAFAQTHREGYFKELKERLTKGPAYCPPFLTIDQEQLFRVLEAIDSQIRTTSRDATVVLFEETGGYHIEPEIPGVAIDIENSAALIQERLKKGALQMPLIARYEYPRVTEAILRAAPPIHRLSAFTTYYGRHDSPNRIHNIKLIASWIDGTLLLPGDECSLSEKIGNFTSERGFKEAYVIYGGVLVPMLGGGTCQIGTTLFNAVSLADLKILQRSNHSFYFNIYPLGRDATVYPGQKDLKFKNDTGHPIIIKAVATNKRLSFRLYGTPTGKAVKFSTPAVYLLGSAGYHPATVREVLAADRPFKTTVIRTVFDSAGNTIKREVLYSSYKLYGEKTNVPIARPEPR